MQTVRSQQRQLSLSFQSYEGFATGIWNISHSNYAERKNTNYDNIAARNYIKAKQRGLFSQTSPTASSSWISFEKM